MGIMNFTNTILKNLFDNPATTEYPKKEKENYELTRGHVEVNMESCILCGMCGRICPTCAITVDRGNKEWKIDRLKCLQCGYCCESCPKKSLTMKNEYIKPTNEDEIDKFTKI